MSGHGIEINCPACGVETLLRREPVYDGFRKSGEKLLCASCGHAFAGDDDVPYVGRQQTAIFSDADRLRPVEVFDADERRRNCRYCRDYVVNPFTQWCSRHHREVEATDVCPEFTRRPEADGDGEAASS
jgi:predicted RNA-binding Zn-ribbon protein involved in translation (DUF1610 family)